jgi:predicted NBD/HSP70 family sugar kinase
MTGNDLMAATKLSRPTIHAVCDELIRLGWVIELDSRRPNADSRPGRPARRYEFNSRAGYVLGIDIGAHKVTVLLADLSGDPVAEVTRAFKHDRVSAADRLATVRRAATSALTAADVDASAVLAVSAGVPAPVDKRGHVIASDEYLPGLARLDVPANLGRGFDCPVLVENDANLAVLGERWRGAAVGVDNVVVLLAGERLGAGLFLGGHLIRGSNGGAGEMAFLAMVEHVGNTDAIGALARRLGAEAVTQARRPTEAAVSGSLYELVAGDPGEVRAETVLQAVNAGDPIAVEVLDRVLDRIARVIAVLATLLDPELVIIGGGVAKAGDLLVGPLEARLPALTASPPPLGTSGLGGQAVVVGAVRRALDDVESRLLEA